MLRIIITLVCSLLSLTLVGAAQAAESQPLSPCENCGAEGWPVALSPGDVRLALPSPDGSMLAVFGGPGKEGRDHTVLVVGKPCQGLPSWVMELSNGAPWVDAPPEAGIPFVTLVWSDDSQFLYAAGDVYQLTKTEDGARAERTRRFEHPVFDLRFGPQRRLAMVEFLSGKEQRTRSDGQRNYAIRLNYQMALTTQEVNIPIKPRKKHADLWVPREMMGEPAVSWDPDGALLLYTPYESVTERFLLRKAREIVADKEPDPRPQEGHGPFVVEASCGGSWELVPSRKSDRVVWKPE